MQKAPLCKGSWHGEAVTEGLLPHQRFAPMAKQCSRRPVSVLQLSSAAKTALLTGSSGIDQAPVFCVRLFFFGLKQNPTAQVNPSVSLTLDSSPKGGAFFLASVSPAFPASDRAPHGPSGTPAPTRRRSKHIRRGDSRIARKHKKISAL